MNLFLFLILIFGIGLTHGLEPAHGWPIALLYSVETKNQNKSGFISSSLIAIAHFISSVAAVIIYIIINQFFDLESFILSFIAFIILLIMAIISVKNYIIRKGELHLTHSHNERVKDGHDHKHYHEDIGEHTHFHRHFENRTLNLKSIVSFAFLLGFAHEEEFALLGLAFAGINPYVLMITYAVGVYLSLVGITLLSIRIFETIKKRVNDIEKYLPLVNFASFLILAILILIDLF